MHRRQFTAGGATGKRRADSFQMCFRDEAGLLGTAADPRRMGVADGLR